jgi:hypothetical protein
MIAATDEVPVVGNWDTGGGVRVRGLNLRAEKGDIGFKEGRGKASRLQSAQILYLDHTVR